MIRLADVALVVPDQDAAIAFYCGVLGFEVVEDSIVDGKRWVKIRAGGVGLVLRRASNEDQRARIGNQTGGSVFLFLETDDFAATHARWTAAGVTFLEAPRPEPYGTVAKFVDPFGNVCDLIAARKQF